MKIFEIIPIIEYAFVGTISIIIAYLRLSNKKFILFHEKTAEHPWINLTNAFNLLYWH